MNQNDNRPQFLDFEASIKFKFNSEQMAEHFSEVVQPGMQGQRDDWPAEFSLGDYPWDQFRVTAVDHHGKTVRVNLVFRVLNATQMSEEDLEDAALDDLEALEGVDANEWYIASAAGGMLDEAMFGGKRNRRRVRRGRGRGRSQKGGEALPMPAPYFGKIPGMVQPDARPGQDLAHPDFATNTVRPFLPVMGGKRTRRAKARKGGFVPSIMEPFVASASQVAAPMALYAGYKLLTKKTARKSRKARKTRRN